MTPAEERERVVHRLSEHLTVALSYCGPLRDEINLLRGNRSAALDTLATLELAVAAAVKLFPDLRRVL